MKKNNITLQDIKKQLLTYKGKSINIIANRGRNKIEKFAGTIENIYPAVFTIKTEENCKTYSYSDVLCGNVKIENI